MKKEGGARRRRRRECGGGGRKNLDRNEEVTRGWSIRERERRGGRNRGSDGGSEHQWKSR